MFEDASIHSLTRGMKRMDEAAWSEFHRRYFSRLYAYALVVLRDNASAEDCVQQTFLRVVRHIRCFDREEVFWSWLTCLARCAAIDLGRAGKRRSRLAERFAQWREVRQPGAVLVHEGKDWQEHLEACLGDWPASERRLIERRYYDVCSHAELAVEFQTTEKAIESKLARLRKKLRASLLRKIRLESTIHEKPIT